MRIPDSDTFKAYLRAYLLLSVAFLLVYGITNYGASLRAERYQLYFAFERHIPFVPKAIVAYLSICALFVLPVVYLDKVRIVALSKAFLVTLVVAGVSFAVFPADPAHSRPETVSFLPAVFNAFYAVELPHNLMPSLHIAYTVLFLMVCCALEMRWWLVLLYVTWGAMLFGSVLLLRQHQLVDVITGAALGWAAYRFVYLRSQR